MENDFAPVTLLQKMIRYWWIVVIIMILGGGVGLLLNPTHPAIYESKAVLSTAVDYAFLNKLDDWEEDQIFQAVGDVIHSTAVMNQVVVEAGAQGITLSNAQLQDSFEIDRQDTRWVLRVRDQDPQRAQFLNSLWSKAAIQALSQLRVNAVASIAVQESLNSLVGCLEDKVVVDAGAALCPELDVAQVKDRLAQIAKDPELQMVWNALALSHTSFELTGEASLPISPVLNGRNIHALAGMLVGLILGVWLISSDLLPKLKKTGAQ